MMKKKFDLTSSKVKSVCFNKNRHNWVAVGLFTGEVQIWDFRNGFQVVEFKENEQCIRSVDFHPIQSLVTGAGDDMKVRGWDFSENKKVFELTGHVDFVRTVQFHHELPWILSASDDQTIRIWNWQSKTQLSVITGHGHYIMCARFHPIKDLIVSGSLDSTLRIWDFSRLKSKFSSAHGTVYMLSNDVEPFIITEAHMKGVNWVAFHPTENIVATCSDDKLIKLWNFTSSNAFEDQVFHGHNHNVSYVVFSEDGKYLFSNGEDFTLRMWDLKGNQKCKFEVADQKQWSIAVHPKLPLLAIGCDKSFNIISILPEAIVYSRKQKFVVYYSNKDGSLKLSDLVNHTSKSFQFGFRSNLDSNKSFGKEICLNQFCSDSKIEGFFKIKNEIKENCLRFFSIRLSDLFNYDRQWQSENAVFTSKNNFVSFENGNLGYYKIKNFQMLKSINLTYEINKIFDAIHDHILVQSQTKLIMLNVQTEEEIFQIEDPDLKNIKKITWNQNRSYFVIQNEVGIWIVSKKGKIQVQKKIEFKVKSLIWDGLDCVIFNSHEHIKYLLINGEEGIIRTVDKILFLISENDEKITYLDLNEEFEQIEIDKSEINLKKAILHQKTDQIKALIKNSEFLGKSMISYLMKKQVNHFTQQLTNDKETSFYLALHSENLEEAFQIARDLKDNDKLKILADACTKIGKFSLAESCLKMTHQSDKLMTHFLLTGNQQELASLEFNDLMSSFNQTFFTGDIKQRIKILAECGQVALAYSAAKIHNLTEFVEALENTFPDISSKVEINEDAELLLPPSPLVPNNDDSQRILYSWPMKEDPEEEFQEEISFVSGDDYKSEQEEEDNEELYKKAMGGLKYTMTKKPQESLDHREVKVDEKAQEAWGVEDNLSIDLSDDDQEDTDQAKTRVEKNSLLAWEHFVVGSLDSGFNLLKSQIGIHNVGKMNELVKQLTVNQNAMLGDSLPNPFDITHFQNQYNEILVLASQAKLKETIQESQNLLQELIVAKASDNEQKEYYEKLRMKLLNYIISFQSKIKNDEEKDLQKKTELCCIMAMTTLEPAHALLILQIAINNLYKLGCYIYAAFVVRKFLKISEEAQDSAQANVIKKMNKVLKSCQQKGSNKFQIEFSEEDLYNENFNERIDFEELQLIDSKESVQCPFDQSSYRNFKKGQLCKCCDLCEIGFIGLGLKMVNNQI